MGTWNMTYENIVESNILEICQKIESTIRDICGHYSYRSIVERVLTDVCLAHYNYLLSLEKSVLNVRLEDELYRLYFQSPTLQAPEYVACFSTVHSASGASISEAEYKNLRSLVLMWLFLTEIPYNGLLYYFDSLRVNLVTFDVKQRFRLKDYADSRARFEGFLSEYALFEAVRPQALVPTIFQSALEDLEDLDDVIRNRIGVSPSRILKALFDLTVEWGATFKLPVDLSEPHEVTKARMRSCYFLMDYPLELLKEILKPVTAHEIEQMFSYVTLTSERASKYIESRKTRKRNQETSMFTYPLWDYPLLKIDQNYLSHPALFAECFEELAYRFISCSEEAVGRFVNKQHEKLIEQCCSILADVGFDKIESNLKIREAGIDKAEFDILALKNGEVLHIECKTEITPWRMRMYFNPKELEKEGLDFLSENKLNAEAWSKKLQWLGPLIRKHFGSNCAELSNIVVTDTPTPAEDICQHVNIIWVGRLESYLRYEYKS